jgi:uncharacterized protein YkwD
MKNFKKILLLFVIGLGFLSIFGIRESGIVVDTSSRESGQKQAVEKLLAPVADREIQTPPPLKLSRQQPGSSLTEEGVVQMTNEQREIFGLPPLKVNARLQESAGQKLQDMFLHQYFAHESPSGKGVGDFMDEAGYEFILAGENLALGDFKDDQDLVQGWMESEGHRKNILNEDYREIGIAVMKGIYEGRETWIAVQHFGLPLSACPSPEEVTKEQIEGNKDAMAAIFQELTALGEEINSTRFKHGSGYLQKIDTYNGLVSQYNALISETEYLIEQYNLQVNAFNDCVSQSN